MKPVTTMSDRVGLFKHAYLKETSCEAGLAFPPFAVDVNMTHSTVEKLQEVTLDPGFNSVVTFESGSECCG